MSGALRTGGGDGPLRPGEIRPAPGDRPVAPDLERIRLVVTNTGRRVVRVSSHYPFARTNRRLAFDRDRAVGFRLDLAAGATERWGPGETKEVGLVRYGGAAGATGSAARRSPAPAIRAAERIARFGPGLDDRIRLGDTDLWLRVTGDRTAPDDPPIWGYGKNLGPRMTQATGSAGASELDVLVAGAVLVDPALGVIKADIGIKDGRVAGVGR